MNKSTLLTQFLRTESKQNFHEGTLLTQPIISIVAHCTISFFFFFNCTINDIFGEFRLFFHNFALKRNSNFLSKISGGPRVK